jgi:uncharacterized protein
MIQRAIYPELKAMCFSGKAILLLGARQTGKTTLLKQLKSELQVKSTWLNADEADIRQALTTADTSTQLRQLIGADTKLVCIDEAQQIPNIGLKLKLLHDTFPEIQVIATGSSAFDLMQVTQEPMTGRKRELTLYPMSFGELAAENGHLEEKRLLETRMLYGSYPEVINNPGRERDVLMDLGGSYLYKDVLRFDGVRKSSILEKLLQALAFQVGSEVRFHEIAQKIGNIDPATVEKYIDILEKLFIVFKLPAFSRNLRNELKKGKKYYFHDLGIRNLLVTNFSALENRADKGALFENYLISERLKQNSYQRKLANKYFWRTTDQAEIDYIEEYDGMLHAYEFKWSEQKAARVPASFAQAYGAHEFEVITKANYGEWLARP